MLQSSMQQFRSRLTCIQSWLLTKQRRYSSNLWPLEEQHSLITIARQSAAAAAVRRERTGVEAQPRLRISNAATSERSQSANSSVKRREGSTASPRFSVKRRGPTCQTNTCLVPPSPYLTVQAGAPLHFQWSSRVQTAPVVTSWPANVSLANKLQLHEKWHRDVFCLSNCTLTPEDTQQVGSMRAVSGGVTATHRHRTWFSRFSAAGWWWLLGGRDRRLAWKCSCLRQLQQR